MEHVSEIEAVYPGSWLHSITKCVPVAVKQRRPQLEKAKKTLFVQDVDHLLA